MHEHVDVLGLLYLVWSGLFLLAGAILLALTFGALALIRYAAAGEATTEIAAGLMAATFGMFAVIALAWGGIHAGVGIALRHRQPWSRTAALVFAVLDLALLPFGTALGIYALWVLLNDQAREQFRPA